MKRWTQLMLLAVLALPTLGDEVDLSVPVIQRPSAGLLWLPMR